MATHYPYLLDPAVYPDYLRKHAQPPTWETFNNKVQFTALRVFTQKDGHLEHIEEDIDLYSKELKLGNIIWPVFQTVFADNFKELVQAIKKQELYLFDIWGHVPGSATEAMWGHVTPPDGLVEYMKEELGDHFLGFDIGEQDGRYVGGYALQQCPCPGNHYAQYLNFQRHFERMGDDLGNNLTTLVSLCFGHYMLKEGNQLMLGAETAQALPNSQVYYSFIRGACKQYGNLWFGNASVWNRWGYKSYEMDGELEAGVAGGFPGGPEQGTSLSLLKRLLFTHYLYNAPIVGFEAGWIKGDNTEKRIEGLPVPMEEDRSTCVLTPIGTTQAKAGEFIEKNGNPGTMHTPVALFLDFYSGWMMPRQLYSERVFQVWGAMPYERGDYLTHGVFSMLYPGYEDASYYHDERGFLAPTPYGDVADTLLSDAPLWVMKQYGLIVAAGKLNSSIELREKLMSFVDQGGELVLTGANAQELLPDLQIGKPRRVAKRSCVEWVGGEKDVEQYAFELMPITLPEGAEVLASCGERPAVVRLSAGKGHYTVLLSPFGLNADSLVDEELKPSVDQPLPSPYVLLQHVKRAIGAALRNQQLFDVGKCLSSITCRKGKGKYTLGVHNNYLHAKPLKINSLCGPIKKITELQLDHSEKAQRGYWPTNFANNDGGVSDEQTIAGGDIRLFEVEVDEQNVVELPKAEPPKPPVGRLCNIRARGGIKEAILDRPTFLQRFDGVKAEWRYLRARDASILKRLRGWLERQGVRIIVDFSSGLNFYPDLTLLDTFEPRYEEGVALIDDVFDKMAAFGSKEAVFSLHRTPENHCTSELGEERFIEGIKSLCERAAARGITVYLQHHTLRCGNGWWPKTSGDRANNTIEFIRKVGAPNLKFALNTGHAEMSGEPLDEIIAAAGDLLGLVLINAPTRDQFGQMYDSHKPVHESSIDLSALSACAHVPWVLDVYYENPDDVHLDYTKVWGNIS